MTDRNRAFTALERLRDAGISDTQILEHLIGNELSGSVALDAMSGALEEFIPGWDEEED